MNFSLAIMEGYPTFIISILMIGMNTAVIGDVAGHLGCFIYLKDCVNAIAFVALGTSVPGRPCMQWLEHDVADNNSNSLHDFSCCSMYS